LLCKYYNALVLCENDEISFIEYMKAKGDAHMLIKMGEVTWLKDAVAATTVSREYGIHRSSELKHYNIYITNVLDFPKHPYYQVGLYMKLQTYLDILLLI